MTELLMIIMLGVLGLILGSFAGATVWRLRARQLVEDKKSGEKVNAKELKRLKPLVQSVRDDRSRCLHCGHSLAWYDLVPLVSWLSTKGKCRYCKQSIGVFEPLIELGTATALILLALYWPQLGYGDSWALFVAWIVAIVMLVILFAYDSKWFLLPNVVMFPLIGVSAAIALVHTVGSSDIAGATFELVFSVAILSGIYWLLYQYSRWRNGEGGTWVGYGDVKLGLALGLLIADWRLAVLTLFLANLIGVIIVLPGLLTKKLSAKAHIPFGPLLIAGFFIALFWGQLIIDWYLQLVLFT